MRKFEKNKVGFIRALSPCTFLIMYIYIIQENMNSDVKHKGEEPT